MGWLELIVIAIYIQAFYWYGRLSYVQGVLDRHHDPDCRRVRKVLNAGYDHMPARVAAIFNGRGGSRQAR